MLNAFFEKLRPADVIGIIVIIGGFYLLLKGVDHVVGGLLIAVVTYYFVRAKHNDKPKTDQSKSGNGGA